MRTLASEKLHHTLAPMYLLVFFGHTTILPRIDAPIVNLKYDLFARREVLTLD
jgi:hypothetical protein